MPHGKLAARSTRHKERATVAERQDTRDVVNELRQCLRRHDRGGAVTAILKEIEAGRSIEDLYGAVLEPFLHWVGAEWQEGRAAVWEEHLIVSAVRTAVDALYPLVLKRKESAAPIPVTVAFFCPSEETHDLGLRMLADRFELRGFRTVYVGAMTPVAQMIECARAVQADLICLSASSHFQRAALLDVLGRLQSALPATRLVVGGPAFARSDEGWQRYSVESLDLLMDELAAGAQGARADA